MTCLTVPFIWHRHQSPYCGPGHRSGSTAGFVAIGFRPEAKVVENDIIKPLRVLAGLIAQAMRIEQTVNEQSLKLIEENSNLKQELKEKYEFGHLIGNSSPMRQVCDGSEAGRPLQCDGLASRRERDGQGTHRKFDHYNSLKGLQLLPIRQSQLCRNAGIVDRK